MIGRLAAKIVRKRAEVLRWRAFEIRIRAHVGHPLPETVGARAAELQARLLNLRAQAADSLAEWMEGR